MGDEICEERGVGMEEERRGMVKWERFLPRVSVRVLLVESDDSTRQIIAALLRKCSYKVTAISDGLKAWETLQNKSHNIDLVLTEVEVPSVSGFALLSMIMDHDSYKNIPVIMMSSDDSINMVFKCMTKGAADFLVKPIRKNELKNLWQHVWRRHISIGRRDGAHGHQNENIAKKKLDNHSGEYVALEKKDCSEKGSEVQSSCTRSDMEAELYMQNMHDIKPRQERDLSPMVDTLSQESKENNQLESASLIHEGEAEDNFITLGSGVSTFNRACNSIEPTLEEDQSCELMEAMDEGKHCNEVIDLIGALDNQMQSSYGARDISPVQDGLSDASEKCKSNSVPHLELSLRKYQPSSYHKLENDEWNMLSHSNFSAFSLFSGKPVVPTPLRAVRTFTEQNECFDSSNLSIEVTKPPGLELNRQEEMAAQCSPFRAIPFTIPVKQMALNSSCTAYHAAIQPIYYSQAVHPLWSATWQNAATANSPHQSQHKDLNSQQSHRQDDQSPTSVIRDREQRQEDVKEGDEQRRVSSVTCESGSDECNANTSVSSLEKNVESANWEDRFSREVINPPDSHRLSQREAALNKFRMKRKERCFDKKVRYQSRKRLAEQRPRVKGQFVRQV